MKTAPNVSSDLRLEHNMTALPRLTAEWNLNRYYEVVASNTPSEDLAGFDIDRAPIESIVQPNRPGKGINKAMANAALTASTTSAKVDGRFYTATEKSHYKYWISPGKTNGSGVMDSVNTCRPRVNYGESVQMNKIVIGFENTWATPSAFTIHTMSDSSTVVTTPIFTGTAADIDNNGRVVLYWDGSSWSTTPSFSATVPNYGIEVRVTALSAGKDLNGATTSYNVVTDGPGATKTNTTGFNSHCSVIEISGRRVEDLSSRLISPDDSVDLSDTSIVYPLGTLTSNGGSVSLSNYDDALTRSNPSSPYFGILEPNVEFSLEYVYETTAGIESVQQFKMFAESWDSEESGVTTVPLKDYFKFWQEIKPLPTLYRDLPVTQIIWRLCDREGFANYSVNIGIDEEVPRIPFFWTDGEKTMMEILDELSRATQTAIYFDAYGELQISTKEKIFDRTASPVWQLNAEPAGSDLPDIIELREVGQFETNDVLVNYRRTSISDTNNGHPKLDTVWEPDGVLAMRSSSLVRTLTAGTTTAFWIESADAAYWPFTGVVQIEGEMIRYDAKQLSWYTGATRHVGWIASVNQYSAIVKGRTNSKITWTGAMRIAERGYYNTGNETNTHGFSLGGYSQRYKIGTATPVNITNAVVQDRVMGSRIIMRSTSKMTTINDFLYCTINGLQTTGYALYGTRIFFPKDTRSHSKAGIVINNSGTSEDGYYIEATPITSTGDRWEISAFTKKANVTKNRGPQTAGKWGVSFPVVKGGREIDLDAILEETGPTHTIHVFANGKKMFQFVVSGADMVTKNSRFGLYVRGRSAAEFEHLYAVNGIDPTNSDEPTIWDRIYGGYQDHFITKRITNLPSIRRSQTKVKTGTTDLFFDDFGPIVHEVREFDVKFSQGPVTYSELWLLNPKVVCTQYRSTSFGANFMLHNASRNNEIIHGGDKDVLAIFGRVVTQEDAEHVEVKDTLAIRKRGLIQTEVESNWIQTKDMAQNLAEWTTDNWAVSSDIYEVDVFGNTLFELGDVVSINYPAKSMTPATHTCYVVGISTSFDQGLSTTLTLRRRS